MRLGPGFPRLDDLVDQAALCREIRVVEALLVLLDQLGATLIWIVGSSDGSPVDDIDGALPLP